MSSRQTLINTLNNTFTTEVANLQCQSTPITSEDCTIQNVVAVNCNADLSCTNNEIMQAACKPDTYAAAAANTVTAMIDSIDTATTAKNVKALTTDKIPWNGDATANFSENIKNYVSWRCDTSSDYYQTVGNAYMYLYDCTDDSIDFSNTLDVAGRCALGALSEVLAFKNEVVPPPKSTVNITVIKTRMNYAIYICAGVLCTSLIISIIYVLVKKKR